MALSFYGNINKIESIFSNFQWAILPILLGLSILNYFIRFLKWHYYLQFVTDKVKFLESFLIFHSALALSFSPGKIGDLIKSYFLKDTRDIEVSKTASIVLTERITDFTSLLLIAIFGSFAFGYGVNIILIISLFFLLLIILLSIPKIGEPLIHKFGRIRFIEKMLEPFLTAYRTSNELLSPLKLLNMTLLSFIAWGIECLGFYIILINLNVEVSFFNVSFIYVFSIIVGAVTMLPAGIGFTEGSLTFLLIQSSVTKDVAVAATILVRLITLWFSVIIGVFSLYFYKIYGTKFIKN